MEVADPIPVWVLKAQNLNLFQHGQIELSAEFMGSISRFQVGLQYTLRYYWNFVCATTPMTFQG